MDQSLIHCVPQTRPVLGVYLENLDCEKYQLYQDALQLCQSLEKSVAFLKKSRKEVCQGLCLNSKDGYFPLVKIQCIVGILGRSFPEI